MKSMKVEQLMTRNVHTCAPSDPLHRAAQIMWENDCGCVPVVDDQGEAIAMITDRDICMAAYTRGQRLSEIPVSSAASRKLIVLSPSDTVETAERLMAEYRIRRIPVVDDGGHPIGMISLNDLARHAQGGRGREDHYVTQTLAAISAHTVPPQAAE